MSDRGVIESNGTDQKPPIATSDEPSSQKRKTKQISLSDYFTKRRKMSTTNNEKIETEDSSDASKREILASAAERRLNNPIKRSVSLLDESEAEKRLSVVTKETSSVVPSNHENDDNVVKTNSSENESSSSKEEEEETKQTKVEIPPHFNRSPYCYDALPSLTPNSHHTVLFKPHIMQNKTPLPYPDKYKDRWDKDHVRMPCSPENLYPTRDKKVQNRWELVETTLLQTFSSSNDLEEAILVYNHHYKDKWNFHSWHSYCNIVLDAVQREELFSTLLPGIVNLALQLPNVVTQPPKLLKQGCDHTMTFSQHQIACLLANAFFCTFPRRNSLKSSEYCNYPDINFSRVFRGIHDVVNEVKTEKLKCILNYFRRVLLDMPTGTVTFHRKVLNESDFPDWENSGVEFGDLYVTSDGSIEVEGEGFLQVDFANRMIGGGVVGNGCVQEEIRFLLCPEMIVARLFTEKLNANESLLIIGAERYNSYSGYASTFKFTGNFNDFTARDRWGRRYCEMVAIDAHVFHCYKDQFKGPSLKRELVKAYCGFRQKAQQAKIAVATGNWGCGAFGGDVYLKSLLQLIAASQSGRDIVYFTFRDEGLVEKLRNMHEYLRKNKVTIGKLWSYLVKYGNILKSNTEHVPLYPYLKDLHEKYEAITDDDASSCNEDNPLEIRGVPCEIPSDMSPLSPDYAGDTP